MYVYTKCTFVMMSIYRLRLGKGSAPSEIRLYKINKYTTINVQCSVLGDPHVYLIFAHDLSLCSRDLTTSSFQFGWHSMAQQVDHVLVVCDSICRSHFNNMIWAFICLIHAVA